MDVVGLDQGVGHDTGGVAPGIPFGDRDADTPMKLQAAAGRQLPAGPCFTIESRTTNAAYAASGPLLRIHLAAGIDVPAQDPT